MTSVHLEAKATSHRHKPHDKQQCRCRLWHDGHRVAIHCGESVEFIGVSVEEGMVNGNVVQRVMPRSWLRSAGYSSETARSTSDTFTIDEVSLASTSNALLLKTASSKTKAAMELPTQKP